ncbi:MAG: Ig-like domain repeat protein, partial [Mycobacteriales bacterium]
TWSQAGATSSYQWRRDGAPINAATGTTYLLVPADLGHAIAVTVTGHQAGYTDATVTSDPVTTLVGDPITFVAKPRLSGTPRVGRLLTADPGTWTGGAEGDPAPVVSYQWNRDGTPIPGAVGQQYQVQRADAGHRLTATVGATRPAYKPGTFTTAYLTVARLASSLTASLAKATIARGKAAVLRLTLRVPGVSGASGVVKVLDGAKVVRTVTVRRGTATAKITHLKPGKHRLHAVYAGTTSVAGSSSRTLRLTVKR